MKLYDGLGPNPRFVRMLLLEKGIDLDTEQVDLLGGENRQAEHMERNPMGQLPALELDSGEVIAEITAIGEYLEEVNPATPLVGTTAEERATTRMWTRRIDHNICEPLVGRFRNGEGEGLFRERIRTMPEAADGFLAIKQENLAKLDGWIAGRDFICGDRFTMADILLYVFLDFGTGAAQPVPTELANISAHFARVGARPSAEASLHPVAVAGGMRA